MPESPAARLSIGLQGALHIREERLTTHGGSACRLLYVSDIHLRRSRSERLSRQIIDAAMTHRIDAVLLGGDLVDQRDELNALRDLVAVLSNVAPVYAVGGNHDCLIGLNLVRHAIVSGGGEWIHAGFSQFAHGSRVIAVSGPDTPEPPDGDVRILCAHNPRIWKAARRQNYDLVLAGHLHGCQLVAFEFRGWLFPGAAFYPNCCLRRQDRSTRLVVSRGVSDFVPIRWRCPREVILCYV